MALSAPRLIRTHRIASLVVATLAGAMQLAPSAGAQTDSAAAVPPPAAAGPGPFATQSAGTVVRGERALPVVVVTDTAAPARDTAVARTPRAAQGPASVAPAASADTVTAGRPAGARPAAASTAAAASTGGRTHTVAAGETFFAVARRYSVTPGALRIANPRVVPDSLRTGTVLRIPGSAPATPGRTSPATPARVPPRGTSSAAPSARPSTGVRRHTVVKGETLFGLARRYGVSAARLRAANRLEGDGVKIGQVLVIPAP